MSYSTKEPIDRINAPKRKSSKVYIFQKHPQDADRILAAGRVGEK